MGELAFTARRMEALDLDVWTADDFKIQRNRIVPPRWVPFVPPLKARSGQGVPDKPLNRVSREALFERYAVQSILLGE